DGSGWVHEVNDCDPDNHSCGWYIRMLQDTTFANELRCTYETYRTTILDTTQIFSFIDSVAGRVDIAQARHFQKWPILGISGPAPEVNEVATTYAGEIDTLKAWITTRLAWLDVNMPGECSGQPNGMSTSPAVANLRIFPNPSAGRFHVEGSASAEGPRLIVLRDVAWRVVQEIPLSNGPFSREIELRESGVYFFTLECNGRMLQQEKLVVY
ncbi:MAG: CotH kinase family protein, partial [Flavobacteriales bacterium]